MSWFWNSLLPTPQSPSSPSKDSSLTQSTPSNPPNPHTPTSIDAFVQNLEEETRIPSAKFKRNPQLASLSTTRNGSESEGETEGQRIIPALGQIEDDLLPTELTVSQALDAAYYCQSFGGKFKDLYRFGELRSCGEHWGAFWFAMKMKSTREPMKSEMIKDHFRQRALKYKVGPSSEDVWKSRDELIRPEEAFPFDFPKRSKVVSDAEWQAYENERRRTIREPLFGKDDGEGGGA